MSREGGHALIVAERHERISRHQISTDVRCGQYLRAMIRRRLCH
jgi:hypothetical protein